MVAPSEPENLEEYRSLLEDIIELQKQVARLPFDPFVDNPPMDSNSARDLRDANTAGHTQEARRASPARIALSPQPGLHLPGT